MSLNTYKTNFMEIDKCSVDLLTLKSVSLIIVQSRILN